MKRDLVVDASIAIKWVVPEDDSALAVRLRPRFRLLAPQLIFAECANIIWKHVRQGKLPVSKAVESSRLIEDLDIDIASMRDLAPLAVSFSLDYDHPAYDSFYLALAVVQGCPFVTADQSFVRKIRQRNTAEASLCVLLSEADSL